MSQNLFLTEDAQNYMKEALRFIDGLTEHEKFTTRGLYFRMMADDQQCVREYGELLARYPADAGHGQRRARQPVAAGIPAG